MNVQILTLCLLSSLHLVQSQCHQAPPVPTLTYKSVLARGVLLFWRGTPNACYKIKYESKNLSPPHTGESGPYSVTMATVLGLEENTAYKVMICAARSCACTPDQWSCLEVPVGTPAAKPSGPAGALAATQVREDSISVSWTEPETRHQNGRINGYKACISGGTSSEECHELGVAVKHYTFTCLRPYTGYVVTVAARNSNGYGEGGRGLSLTTEEGTPSAPALRGVVTQKDSTSILVAPPTLANGEVVHYEVLVIQHRKGSCCNLNGGSRLLGKYRANSNLLAVTHTTLDVGMQYCFWVRAINNKHTGGWSGTAPNANTPASNCPSSSAAAAPSGEPSCVKPVTIRPVMGKQTVVAETPSEATACIDIHPPQQPAVLEDIIVFYSTCEYDQENPEPEKNAIFSASLTCQRLIGLRPGICYQFSFSVKVVIGGLPLPTARSASLRVPLPSLESDFRLPPRGHLAPTSTCSIYGFHHVTTFDGQPYSISEMGRYKIVKDIRDYALMADIRPCNASSMACLDNLEFVDQACDLRVRMRASSCGGSIDISYGSCQPSDVLSWIEGCRRHVSLSRANLTIVWDGLADLRVHTTSGRQAELCGLCGDYNGDRQGELAVEGQNGNMHCKKIKNDEPKMQCLMKTFARRWQMRNSPKKDLPAKCSWSASPEATQTCAVLMDSSGAFSQCFSRVNFATFHRQCIHDTCGEEPAVRQARFCSLAAEYVARCAQAGAHLALPRECQPQQSFDCILMEQEIPGFDFGSINDASPHNCATNLQQRRCMSSPRNPSTTTCKPSRSGILEVDYTCSLIGKENSAEHTAADGKSTSKGKMFKTTLKVPEDFSCDIYT